MSKEKKHIYQAKEFFKDDLPIVMQRYVCHPEDFFPSDIVNTRQFWKVFYVVSGTGILKMNHRDYPFAPGFVCLNHPDDLTNIVSQGELELVNILFFQKVIADELRKLSSDYHFFAIFNEEFRPDRSINHEFLHLLDSNRKIFTQLKRMDYEYNHADANSKAMLRFMLLELLVELARLSSRAFPRKRHREVVGMIDKYLHEHYAEPFSSAQAAAEAGISQGHLFNRYRQATGRTIGETLLRIRLDKATELLKNTTLPIIEICYQCGFSDLSNFYKVFKRECGCNPGDYRKRTPSGPAL